MRGAPGAMRPRGECSQPSLRVRPWTGSIQARTLDCRKTSRHSTSSMPTDQGSTFLKISDSLPGMLTAVAAMARD